MTEGDYTGAPTAGAAMPDMVSLQALAMPDESDRMETPQVGDRVSYQVEGVIASIEGENAFVTKEAVNGQPVTAASEPTPESALDDIGQLEQDAQAMSAAGGF